MAVFLFSGCGHAEDDQEQTFTLSKEQRKEYKEEIDQVLYDFYWRYDGDSLLFFSGVVPEKKPENEAVFLASQDAGYLLKNYAGKDAVVATVKLQHFNGDKAGLAYFYFVKNRLAGVYYSGGYQNENYSLKIRNLYLAKGDFTKYETDSSMANFKEQKTANLTNGFVSTGFDSKGSRLAASIMNGKVVIYRYGSSFYRYRILYAGNGLNITSATFLPENGGQMAVLAGKVITQGQEEGETSYIASEKVVFYNDQFQKSQEMELPSADYTCVASDDEKLVLANGNILEYYNQVEGKWQKERQYFLKHGVTDFHIADLDGNGVKEYLLTDGLDLYLYHKTEGGFIRIWSTHIGIETLTGTIYTGDLNQDGVKEIYICDNTGTTIRYILTETGLRSRNEDIEYGEHFYVADFNGDQKDDYIEITDIEKMDCKAWIAQ